MSDLSQFGVSGLPIGAIIQAPYPPALPGWQRCDGRVVARSAYPLFAATYTGSGPITYTVRSHSIGGANQTAFACADAANFIITGCNGDQVPFEVTPDGVTVTRATGWISYGFAGAIISTGARFVMASSVGDAIIPMVTPANQSAAMTAAKANWVTTTGVAANVIGGAGCLAYGLGQVIGLLQGAGTLVYSLPDGSNAWTAKNAPSHAYSQATFDGKYFWLTNTDAKGVVTRYDGTSFVDVQLPALYQTGTASGIASDGNGTIILIAAASPQIGVQVGYGLIVSKDNGASWGVVEVPLVENGLNASWTNVNCANGLFKLISSIGADVRYSRDAVAWNTSGGIGAGVMSGGGFAYKSGIYVDVASAASSVTQFITCVEDVTKMVFPRTTRLPTGGGSNVGWQEWIKVI